MIKKTLLILSLVALISCLAILCFFLLTPKRPSLFTPAQSKSPTKIAAGVTVKPPTSKTHIVGINVEKLTAAASKDGLNPKVLKAALNSYVWARNHGKLGNNKQVLTVVDFTLPSYQKRMWVLDLESNQVLMKLYTTHGKGSGMTYATHFSNQARSETSSLGLYVTAEEYYGHHDKSLRIVGLEKGINSNALSRDIVIHAANYATPEYIKSHHRAGRSWGCFAVAPAVKDQLIKNIRGGSALFSYAAPEDHDPIVYNGPIKI